MRLEGRCAIGIPPGAQNVRSNVDLIGRILSDQVWVEIIPPLEHLVPGAAIGEEKQTNNPPKNLH